MTSTNSSSAASARHPLRVVLLNTSRSWGGTEHYAVQLAAGLKRRGHSVRLFWAHRVIGERARQADLPATRCRLRADADLVGLWRLARLLRAERADAVVLTKWREYLLGGLAAHLAGVPLSVVSLGLRVFPRRDLKRRLIFALTDLILVNAEEIRAALATRPWIDAQKVRVIHNGVDLDRFRPGGDGATFRREIGVPVNAPLFGTIGALTPQKDHELLVRAAARVRQQVPDAHFVVVGDGFLRPQLEERIQQHDLADCFHLAGFHPDVRPALAAFDTFVLSSDNEGMAWVLLEALAVGLPVVATDVSGSRACVEEGVNGHVVPPGNAAALAAALIRLAGDAEARSRLGRASRRRAEVQFAAERMVGETERALLEGRARRGNR